MHMKQQSNCQQHYIHSTSIYIVFLWNYTYALNIMQEIVQESTGQHYNTCKGNWSQLQIVRYWPRGAGWSSQSPTMSFAALMQGSKFKIFPGICPHTAITRGCLVWYKLGQHYYSVNLYFKLCFIILCMYMKKPT